MPDTAAIARKVDFLFKTFRKPDGKEYTYDDIEQGTAEKISASYVWRLRNGKIANPGLDRLQALCEFFSVEGTYWFEDLSEEREDQLRLQAALKESGVKEIALRASDLSSEGRRALLEMIKTIKNLNGRTAHS